MNEIFQYLNNNEFAILLDKIKDGDINFVLENEVFIKKLLPSSFTFLKEKTYLVALTNICFYKTNRSIMLEELIKELGIERSVVIYVVLRALGLGLIKGSFDGEREILRINYVTPRILSFDEMKETKMKFQVWQRRIEETIKLLK